MRTWLPESYQLASTGCPAIDQPLDLLTLNHTGGCYSLSEEMPGAADFSQSFRTLLCTATRPSAILQKRKKKCASDSHHGVCI